MEAFDDRFLKEESNEKIIKLFHAANYLRAKNPYDSVTKAVAERIKNRSVESTRKLLENENMIKRPEEEQPVCFG